MRVGHAERLAGRDRGGLEPVDPDRLLVPGLVLEADVDEIAGLEHLLRGLRIARLVAVHRLERDEARQETGERQEDEERAGADMAPLDEPEDRLGEGHAGRPAPDRTLGRKAGHRAKLRARRSRDERRAEIAAPLPYPSHEVNAPACAGRRAAAFVAVAIHRRNGAIMAHHRIEAGPETVHWGYFDAALPPLVTVDSGDTVTISTVSGPPEMMPPPPLVVPPALSAVHASPQAEAAGPHLHRAGRGPRRQGRPGPRGSDQGHRAPLRLGLQLLGAAERRAAGRFPRDPPDAHPARPGADDRPAPLGLGAAAEAVLRRDGGRAAGALGLGLDPAAAPQRRQPRQQGARRRNDALSPDPRRRGAVLGRRRARRAGRRRGLRHRDRDRARRHLRARSSATTWRSTGRWPRPRPTS